MFTRCSINRAGECIWLSELCNGKLVRDYTGCVICRRGDLVKGLFVRRGDLVKGRSLGQWGDGGRELEGVQSCISPRDLGWSFSSGSFYLGVAPQT